MSLIKKTVILSDFKGVAKGVANFIRIGNEATVKISLKEFKSPLRASVKHSKNGIHTFSVEENKAEIMLPFLFDVSDELELMLASDKPLYYGATKGRGGFDSLFASLSPDKISVPKMVVSVAKATEKENFSHDEEEIESVKTEDAGFDKLKAISLSSVLSVSDEMFLLHPKDVELEALLPSSKWVKIKYNEEDFYSFGLLMAGDTPTHIMYAIKSDYNTKPPKEVEGICDFLPKDYSSLTGEGWWIIYQDIISGKPVIS